MAKLSLTDIATFGPSAITAINNNNAAIETAMENTLSRDGTTPNSMRADLDMNSNAILNMTDLDMNNNRIINLPAAILPEEPVRKQEFDQMVLGGTGQIVVGPASSTDNAVARFDGTSGAGIQNSTVTISDAGLVNIPGSAGVVVLQTSGGRTYFAPSSASPDQGVQVDTTSLANGSNALLFSAPTGWSGNYASGNLNGIQKFKITETGQASFTDLLINGVRARRKINAHTTFYVSTTGSDSFTDVLATDGPSNPSNPAATAQAVWNALYEQVDANGYRIKIKFAAGTYTTGIQINDNIVGVKTENQLVVEGDPTDRTAVIIRPTTSVSCFTVSNNAHVMVRYLTCDNVNNAQDLFNIGQYAIVSVAGLLCKGYVSSTAYNDFSVGGFLIIAGDLYFSDGHRQAILYPGEGSTVHLAINNDKSATVTGGTTNGSNVITNITTSGMLVGQIVRGSGIPQNAVIKTIDSGTQISLGDVDGNNVNATATATGVSLIVGGMFWNFSGVTADVSGIFATDGASVNLQAIEFNGTFTGTSYIVKNGARLDLGDNTITVIPGSAPGFVDGATGSSVRVDATGSVLRLPRVSAGIYPGTTADGIIRFEEFTTGGASVTNVDGKYETGGTGAHKFYGTSGSVSYGSLDNVGSSASPEIALGVGTLSPIPAANSAGIHAYGNLASHVTSLKLENDDPTALNKSTVQLIANTGYGQLVSNKTVDFDIGSANWEFGTDNSLRIKNGSAPSSPASGYTTTWTDSTDKIFKSKNDAGTVAVTVIPDTGSSNNFLTAISSAGVISKAQPSAANLSNGTTGSGAVVLATSPSLTTPSLGVATATSINKVALTAPATGSTLTIADGKTLTVSNTGTLSGGDGWTLSIAAAKTLTVSNSLTFTGTDSTSFAFPSSSDTVATLAATQELDNKTLDSSVGKGTWTASGTWTLPAHTINGRLTLTGADISADNGASATNINFHTRTGGSVSFYDSAGGRYMAFAPVSGSSAASYNWPFFNAVGTGNNPYLQAVGDTGDTNVGLDFYAKGTGTFNLRAGSASIYAAIGSSGLSVTGSSSSTSFVQSYNATATPAAASAVPMIKGGSAAVGIYFGTGTPNAALTAPKGSLYVQTDATTTTSRLWVNTDAGTTWANFTSSS